MLQLSEKAKKLYDLLFTKEFSLKLLKNELESGAYTPEDVNTAGFQYVDDCSFDLMDENWRTPCRPQGTVLPGYCSSHMLEALKCLLEYGLDANAIYVEDSSQSNIMSELRYVENGYLTASDPSKRERITVWILNSTNPISPETFSWDPTACGYSGNCWTGIRCG